MPKDIRRLVLIAVAALAAAPLAHADDLTDTVISEFTTICLASDLREGRYDALSAANGWEPLDPAATNDPNVMASHVKLVQVQPIISAFGHSDGEGAPFCSIQITGGDIEKLTSWVTGDLAGGNPQMVPGMVLKTIYEVTIETAPSVATVTVQFAFGVVSLIASK